ncbi:MAG TPA: hypothetical protein VK886_12640 [Vicinamibacterales bacterium]|nr:hypothetical protein [Vicinamibacterales bacterium]
MRSYGRALLLLLLVVWTAKFAFARSPEVIAGSFLHRVDLVFHEAGHVLFVPFGRFMTMLGGSLMQVLVPIVCAVALLKSASDRVGAAVAVWWAGQNLVDLAPYIGDARALQLPLLGGATGAEVEGHDWEAILATLGFLQHDRALAAAAHIVGSLTMAGAIAVATYFTLDAARSHGRIVPGDEPGT